MNTELPMDLTASLDQMGALLKGLSGSLGEYYRGLVSSGIPPEHTIELVRDFHWLQLHNSYYPGKPPHGRREGKNG